MFKKLRVPKLPAVVAWSVKALVFHSVNSSPEQTSKT